jgi:hypothetical protein
MAKVLGVSWATPMGGQDFHVLAGQTSGALADLLAIVDDTSAPYWASSIPPGRGVTVKFVVEPIAGSAPAGVQMGPTTGAMNIATTTTVRSFIVRAEVSDSNGVVFTTKPRIRVQVHAGLASTGPKVWLTPDKLSIHRGSDGQVLSLFAEFADGMVGDITEQPDLTWELVNPASDSSKLSIDGRGALSGRADSPGIPVKVTLPSSWGGLTATAQVEVLPPWGTASTLAPLEAHRVPGSPVGKADAPNLLFLPEGFTDRTQFVDTVNKVVGSLQKSEHTSPFDWLRDDVNYWFAWIPAPSSENGTSVLHEMKTLTRKGRLFGVSPPTNISPETNVPTAGSLLADERNSTLGLGVGGRLNLEHQLSTVTITWYPRRTQRAHLDKFLAALKDPDETEPNAQNIGLTWTTGKDRSFVIALVAGAHYAGTRTGTKDQELIAPALDGAQETELQKVSALGNRMRHLPYDVPKTPALNGRMVIAHEVSHSFGLGDEYSLGGRVTADRLPISELNLQEEGTLKSGQGLDGTKLKWSWPRVERAAELTGAPTGSGPFTIPVKLKQELAFDAQHVVVQLRSRKLDPLRQSDLFRISSKPSGQLVVTQEKAVPNSVGITTFAAGDLVIAPVLSPQTGLPLLLVHEAIAAHITQFHQPMNAPKQPTPARTCDSTTNDARAIQPATNFPAGLQMPSPKYETWQAVGLYEGGATFTCGVFHPTGACVMRRALPSDSADPADETQRVLGFCPVCRYILVDRLAPTRHFKLDHWFARRYPKV